MEKAFRSIAAKAANRGSSPTTSSKNVCSHNSVLKRKPQKEFDLWRDVEAPQVPYLAIKHTIENQKIICAANRKNSSYIPAPNNVVRVRRKLGGGDQIAKSRQLRAPNRWTHLEDKIWKPPEAPELAIHRKMFKRRGGEKRREANAKRCLPRPPRMPE